MTVAEKARGLIVAAPASGSGKTLVTLGLLRALRRRGMAVAGFKIGPDYIDPAFHAAAAGCACVNLDPWAMRPETLHALWHGAAAEASLLIGEGVMGLFDGAASGGGSTADLAVALDLPVLLVVDVRGQAQSLAAVLQGFAGHRPALRLAGVICNRAGGERHRAMLREACAMAGLPLLGCLPACEDLAHPSRHLGLRQAGEHPELEHFLDRAAAVVGEAVDLRAVQALASEARAEAGAPALPLPPLGAHIAVARDAAFAFAYPWLLQAWRDAGAELSFFSPLADEAPAAGADAVFLPGGYPELHGAVLAAAHRFKAGMRKATEAGAWIYGECGGFMVLGERLTDQDGRTHPMLGLLPAASSLHPPHRQLGYRRLRLLQDTPLGRRGAAIRGHEFHYARDVDDGGRAAGASLFQAADAAGQPLPAAGLRVGRVFGSFMHLVDRVCGDGEGER